MKVALIRRRFSATGGAELYLQRLLAALREAGHELHLFAESWTGLPAGVTLHAQSVRGRRSQLPGNFARSVEAELRCERYDCVFSLERTLRQDVYRAGDGLHRVWLQRRRQFAPWWRMPFAGVGAFHRAMLRLEAQTLNPQNTRRIITNSEMVKREILQHFAFPAERIHVVRNGVDLARFQSGKRDETRARFGIRPDEFLLLFTGSGWERKGLRFVLRAMRGALPPPESGTLIGGFALGLHEFRKAAREVSSELETVLHQKGPEQAEQEIGSICGKVKLLVVGRGRLPSFIPRNVIFAGPMSNVEDAYAAADLFLFLPIYEPCANVVFEALAAGLPVITSAQNGAAEMIREGVNGTVVENPADTKAVIEAIHFWWSRRFASPPIDAPALSLDRNVSETMAVLELAVRERMS
jgi:UDP-glucose:(heptosyl)LPS alpha-1,3-glucosyltransferase